MARKLQRPPLVGAQVTVVPRPPAHMAALLGQAHAGADGPWRYRLGPVRPDVARSAHGLYLRATDKGAGQAIARAAGSVIYAEHVRRAQAAAALERYRERIEKASLTEAELAEAFGSLRDAAATATMASRRLAQALHDGEAQR